MPFLSGTARKEECMTSLLINVFGGLAIFIFGMKLMSDGLHKAAGERMRAILRFFSANRFMGVLSGTVVTSIIQSSSATTVMVVGFVNAGLLNLLQAIGIIFGANIGTTVTAQLVAFDIGWVIMPSIIVGLLLIFLDNQAVQGWGDTIIGFGFLFLGMTFMSNELKVLSQNEAFMNAFRTFDCAPVNGWIPPAALLGAIGIGLITTMIIQSSSACTGIIIAMGAGGLLNFYTAVALVMGSNIGTTVTAQLAAIPANRIAKQAAMAHTLFNVGGVLLAVSTFWIKIGNTDAPIFFSLVNYISGGSDLPRHIANAHTVFNVCTTLILLPFVPFLAKLCEKIIPQTEKKVKYQRLEPNLLATPAIALSLTTTTLRKMLKKAWKMVDCAWNTYEEDDEKTQEKAQKLERREQRVDELQQEITDYLSMLMQKELSPGQAAAIPVLIHCTNDAERIGDHTETILELISHLKTDVARLSDSARRELAGLHEILRRQVECTLLLLEKNSPADHALAKDLEQQIKALAGEYEANHLKRLAEGACNPVSGIFFIEMLAEFQKVSRHVANIAERSGTLEKLIA